MKRKIAMLGLVMLALLLISQTAAAYPGGPFDPLWISGPFDPLTIGEPFDPL